MVMSNLQLIVDVFFAVQKHQVDEWKYGQPLKVVSHWNNFTSSTDKRNILQLSQNEIMVSKFGLRFLFNMSIAAEQQNIFTIRITLTPSSHLLDGTRHAIPLDRTTHGHDSVLNANPSGFTVYSSKGNRCPE